MKAVSLTCVFVACGLVAEAAPTASQKASQGQPREKRSSYGHAQHYISPCGAASAPIPSYVPSPYHLSFAPAHHATYAQHGYGSGYGGGMQQYRDNMLDEHEIMSFSDMDPMMSEHPMARLAYAAPPLPHYGPGLGGLLGTSNLGGLVAPAAAGAPSFGVFPNANPGGCSVPLMLSCSPSIVPGRIVSAQPYSSGAGAASAESPGPGHAYRDVTEMHHETQEADPHQAREGSSPQENQHVEPSHQHQ